MGFCSASMSFAIGSNVFSFFASMWSLHPECSFVVTIDRAKLNYCPVE